MENHQEHYSFFFFFFFFSSPHKKHNKTVRDRSEREKEKRDEGGEKKMKTSLPRPSSLVFVIHFPFVIKIPTLMHVKTHFSNLLFCSSN